MRRPVPRRPRTPPVAPPAWASRVVLSALMVLTACSPGGPGHDPRAEVTTVPTAPTASGTNPYDPTPTPWNAPAEAIVWTQVRFRDEGEGGAEWTVRVADVDLEGRDAPRLVDEVVVAPAGAHAYETHAWTPDGTGVLFTRAGSAAASGDDGWLNTELYRTHLGDDRGRGEPPTIERITDGSPAWDEQALFTPDGRNVIWMSSRGHPTRYETVVSGAQWTGFDTDQASNLFGPMFFYAIADPAFRTELFIGDLQTGAVRQLTFDDAVVPEFHFDPSGRRLLWGQGGGRQTRLATFVLDEPTGGSVGTPEPDGRGAPELGPGTRTQVVAPEVASTAETFTAELARLDEAVAVRAGPSGTPPGLVAEGDLMGLGPGTETVQGRRVRVLEHPGREAVTDEAGHWRIEGLPAGSTATFALDEQGTDRYPIQTATFLLGDEDVDQISFQSPSTAIVEGFAGLLGEATDPDRCHIASTVTRQGFSLYEGASDGTHGEPGATVTLDPTPATGGTPIYFNGARFDLIWPDRDLEATTVEGGCCSPTSRPVRTPCGPTRRERRCERCGSVVGRGC